MTYVESAADQALTEVYRLFLDRHEKYGPAGIVTTPGGALNGLRVRLHDKLARLNHYVDAGVQPDFDDEKLRDTFIDFIGYGLIGLLVVDGNWPGSHD